MGSEINQNIIILKFSIEENSKVMKTTTIPVDSR